MPPVTSDSGAAATAAEQVASVLEAAEQTAEQLRLEAEERLLSRIAEAERAAELRVSAAEEEATELLAAAREETASSVASAREEASRILAKAREEAGRLRDEAEKDAKRMRSEADKEAKRIVSDASSKALEVAGKAQSEADRLGAEAAKNHEEAAWRTRDMMRGAEQTAGEIDIEGMQVVRDLRALGDSLRANAERLLGDVQAIHRRMVGQIERVEAAATKAERQGRRSSAPPDADSGSAESTGRARPTERRAGAAGSGTEGELDVPEFLSPG
jgi:cell division septum initiation protein DivIVA